ncbi:hypothetical protein [Vibrio sp. TRT 2004]|uniref:hypothetical protein n=1 Tax=Vibrio sp. TRT 2004 TaxID=3418506 RepID=UPI003CF58E49
MTDQEDKWDTASNAIMLWCGIGILFSKGDFLLASILAVTYTCVIATLKVMEPVRKKYSKLVLFTLVSFMYDGGVVYTLELLGINNLWRFVATFPLACFVYWFGTRKVRPILKKNKNRSF